MNDSLFTYSKLSDPAPDLITQELITYVKRNDTIVKITVKRNFTNGDYDDSMTSEVLYTW